MRDEKLRELLDEKGSETTQEQKNDMFDELMEEYKHKFTLLDGNQANIIRSKMRMISIIKEQRDAALSKLERDSLEYMEVMATFDLYQASTYNNMFSAIDMFLYGQKLKDLNCI